MRNQTPIRSRTHLVASLLALAVASCASPAIADVIVSYHDGSASFVPTFTATNVTASSSDLNGSESWRTSWGGAGATPAGPTGGSASGSNWRLYRANATNAVPSSASDYAGFTVQYTGSGALLLDELTFDYVLATDIAGGGMVGTYEVFARINGGSFFSLGTGSTAPLNGTDVFSPVYTPTVSMGTTTALKTGDQIEFRIGIADNSGVNEKAFFVQGIELAGLEVSKTYQIDIDSTRLSGSDTSGTLSTASGWTSLNATSPSSANGASVTVDGIQFEIASADSSRLRVASGNPNPNALTGDFVFDDGTGQAVILLFGDLPKGRWMVEIWSWDADAPFGNQIVGYRTDGAETIITTTAVASATDAMISFVFSSDGVSAYDVFLRENNASDRTRLNAVRLSLLVPAPAALPAGLGLMVLSAFRGRRRRST